MKVEIKVAEIKRLFPGMYHFRAREFARSLMDDIEYKNETKGREKHGRDN